MKLATFEKDGRQSVGVVVNDRIVPLGHASMLEFIGKGAAALAEAREAERDAGDRGLALSSVTLLAPIPRPTKNVFCVGRNYKLHIEEGARANNIPVKFPEVPEFFTKPPTAVIGTNADIRLPAVTGKLDYEVELACVISRPGRDIQAANAGEHIFGFTVLNDITARDLQRAHGQWFKGKALDTSCPIGPWIVTADAFDAKGDQRIWLTVNGEQRQDFGDLGHVVRLRPDHRAPVGRADAGGGRHHHHRHAIGRRNGSGPADLAQGRRRHRGGHRGYRQHHQYGPRGLIADADDPIERDLKW